MTQIFISYAREDKEFIEDLKSRLGQNSYDTWIDSESIRLGKDWRREIDNGIQDSDVVIVVMTPEAKESEYVTYEWAYALGAKKDVITILLERTPLHSRLEVLQYVDFCKVHRWKEFFKGLEQISDEITHLEQTDVEPSATNDMPTYIRQAKEALNELDPETHENAIETLAQSNHPAAREALVEGLSHTSRNIRVKVAIALAEITAANDVRVVPGLIEGLAYGDRMGSDIRKTARYSLVRMERLTIPALTNHLMEKDDRLRSAAIEIFVPLAEPEDAPVLLKALDREESSGLIIQLERILESFRKAALSALIDALPKMSQRHTMVFIMRTLSKIQDHTATQAIIGKLSDDDKFVRAEAIKALAKLEDVRAIDPLIELLSDEEIVERLDEGWPPYVRRITRVCDIAADVLEHKFGTPEALEAVQSWKQNSTGNSEDVT
jgi:HEAT repeat protein